MPLFTVKPKMVRLNVFITLSMFFTVALSMLLAGALFYFSSARILASVYRKGIVERLEQINRNANDKIVIIDSLFSYFMSNTIIRENLDPVTPAYHDKSTIERRLETERQMSYMIVTNYLWSEGLLNAVYIFDARGNYAGIFSNKSPNEQLAEARKIYNKFDRTATALRIIRGESEQSIYFIKNIFSMYSGEKIAAILVKINEDKWKKICSAGTDENWLIMMYSPDFILNLGDSFSDIDGIAAITKGNSGFKESTFHGKDYFIASQNVDYTNLVSVVAAPKEYLLYDMNTTLHTFIFLYVIIILISLVVITLLSYVVTNPLNKMIAYVRTVSKNHDETDVESGISAIALKAMFVEFSEFVSAFYDMLNRLKMYYTDLHKQQILLKNAEIKALQAQIAPHFLFNVLNTIAWKAEISGNTDIYRMILFLSELLRANILSNDRDFIALKEELTYVRYYIQLQQQRFEDKFTVKILFNEKLSGSPVPRFSIQTLVENAISHGIEPLSEGGRLIVRVFQAPAELSSEKSRIHVEVEDNGVGFPEDFDINAATPLDDSSHTHFGLKNLNQRLILFGESGLSIRREKAHTIVSFRIPEIKGGS